MNLRALRERARLTVLDVAKDLDCAESSIRNWEKGRTTPKLEVWQVFRLRDLYECTEEELVQAVKESMQAQEA
ncbi:transcriptional regulator [Nostoc minutum NIES-26]|uniref:Transcriptional regulator n=1 Tax=Nostoc minutum NIES-26 TaxID=1844469 RepID=A0A367RMM6_9NOSO|nr:helix-turn-helix transcriptional regulator [Dendronalium sp. ChiSLP03b]MDZ8208050.1 helix-turn-helix transcriptional regulator [Dendronalium sp. ChiSLP03b]RCJ37299.1 transcriptional regulator [Nostoc minutum NIES-26]